MYEAAMNARTLERAAALGAMALVLYTVGLQLEDHSWALWSILALALLLEWTAYRRGIETGIELYFSLTPEQRKEIDEIIEEEARND